MRCAARWAAGFVTLLILVSCGETDLPPPLQGTWQVREIGGLEVVGDPPSTLSFEPEGGVTGSSGCNRFNGSMEKWGASLTLGPFGSTRRACDDALMDREQRLFAALEAVRAYRYEGPTLLLVGASGEILLRMIEIE